MSIFGIVITDKLITDTILYVSLPFVIYYYIVDIIDYIKNKQKNK